MEDKFKLENSECPIGWYGIATPIVLEIERYNNTTEEDLKISILQVKEKFGGLRFYISPSIDYIEDMIDRAEDESYKICQFCGCTTNTTLRGVNWLTTCCPSCAEKYNVITPETSAHDGMSRVWTEDRITVGAIKKAIRFLNEEYTFCCDIKTPEEKSHLDMEVDDTDKKVILNKRYYGN